MCPVICLVHPPTASTIVLQKGNKMRLCIITRILGGGLSLLFFSALPVVFFCAPSWQKLGVIPIAYYGWVFARHAIEGSRPNGKKGV